MSSKTINVRQQVRIAAGISEQKAARVCGLRLSTFRAYERQGNFPFHRALRLAYLYGCRLEVFL